jgi:hypothetical protein
MVLSCPGIPARTTATGYFMSGVSILGRRHVLTLSARRTRIREILVRSAMQSSLIGKIEKAKRYAEERDRVKFAELTVKFRGDNDEYVLAFRQGKWTCSCHHFASEGICSHIMALQRILGEMLPIETLSAQLG